MMKGEKIFTYIMLAVSVALVIGSLFIVPFDELTVSSPGGYPVFVSILCLVLAFVVAFGKHPEVGESENEKKVFDPVIVAFIMMLVLYVAGIIYIHYTAATLLFLFASMLYLNRSNWKRAVLISYISTFMILLVFKYLFSVIMP
ncbi:MAG: tripartite tricarboxylate transporter TctB family protein [Coprococcus sp.]